MIAAVLFLELAVFCVYRLERNVVVNAEAQTPTGNIGGSAFAAIPELVRSPYLLGIGVWVALLSYAATIIYFEHQAHWRLLRLATHILRLGLYTLLRHR